MPVTALCGFWPHATTEAADTLRSDNPELHLVRYEAPGPGRLTRSGAGEVPTGDDPAAALVRDLVRVARGHDRADVLAVLPEAYEPDQIRTAWHALAAGIPLGLTTAVPADLVLDGLTDDTPLWAVDLHRGAADERSIGDLVSRQIEQADTVLLAGQPAGDEWEAEQVRVLLHRLAPWSRHRDRGEPLPVPTGISGPVAPLTRGLRGRTVGVHEPVPSHGVVACVFRAGRPFHPARLHGALDDITQRVLRSRGHFWLASRPDLVMTWESADGLTLAPVSGWLADLPDEHWADVDAERRLAAALDWDPYYGDRHHHLAFIGIDMDPVLLHRTLVGCLLTDHELSRGEEVWRRLPDPFTRSCPAPPVSGTARPSARWRRSQRGGRG